MRWIVSLLLLGLLVFSGNLGYESLSAHREADSRKPVELATGSSQLPIEGRVLTARRQTDAFAEVVHERRLKAHLDPFRSNLPADSCVVVRQRDGTVLAERAAVTALTPASTMKLVTAFVALETYGPDHRFATEILALTQPVDGLVEGDIWIRGAGDPLLMTTAYAEEFSRQPQIHTPLTTVADAIAAAGITGIDGKVLGDESRYDLERYNPNWPARYASQNNSGPLTALSVNDGFRRFSPLRPSTDPAAFAAGAIRDELKVLEISSTGSGTETAPPEAVVIAVVESLPLSQIVAEMLQESDNNTAELLVKELGTLDGGLGTTEAGLAVTASVLLENGIRLSNKTLIDGSGLDPTNTLSCSILASIMIASGEGSALAEGLSVAGESGTLAHRFLETPVAGALHAKTGFINTVTGLVGYVDSEAGDELVFALLSNNLSTDGANGFILQELLADTLLVAPGSPRLGDLQP